MRTDLPKLKSTSRGIFDKYGIKTEEEQKDWSESRKWDFQKEIFDGKVRQDQENERFIADRTLLDHFAYCLYRCHRVLTPAVIESLEVLCYENLRKYDALFYFQVGLFTPAADGLRETNPGYHYTIDTILQGLLFKLGVPVWWVPPGTEKERAQFVERRISTPTCGRPKEVLGNRPQWRR